MQPGFTTGFQKFVHVILIIFCYFQSLVPVMTSLFVAL